jgi:putative ATP-dependent endonuclease of OLD family
MKLSRVQITNFRNFKNLDVALDLHAVIVGENKIGKSNFLYALRLLLDPTLPDSARQLRQEDFWDGLERPLSKDDEIRIALELSEFEGDTKLLAVLSEHLVVPEPMTSRITYVFRPIPSLGGDPKNDADYEFVIFGGDAEENSVGYDFRRRLPMDVFHALRDAEGDLSNWRRSPLRPLLQKASRLIDAKTLKEIADKVSAASEAVIAIPEVAAVDDAVTDRIEEMVGETHGTDIAFGLAPTEPDRLIRALRLFIDDGKRGIGEASLGLANLIYLALKELELQHLVQEGNRDHTFLAIEEPEAHLHPHLQRLVYRDLLQSRRHQQGAVSQREASEANRTIFLTTHSPHIVSVSPLRSIVLIRKTADGLSSEASSTAAVEMDEKDVADLERYLDVTRGEIVFSRAVSLVEGDAECFLIPVLARLMGHDFDELGISVCSVSGTNFAPYITFLGEDGLSIPFAVVTDYDPTDGETGLGIQRAQRLLALITGDQETQSDEGSLRGAAKQHGLFLNDYTFEVDLFRCGRNKSMCATLAELTSNAAAKKRADTWRDDKDSLDAEQLLKDIAAIGKGRFAQRLACRIQKDICPEYIRDAIAYIVGKVQPGA